MSQKFQKYISLILLALSYSLVANSTSAYQWQTGLTHDNYTKSHDYTKYNPFLMSGSLVDEANTLLIQSKKHKESKNYKLSIKGYLKLLSTRYDEIRSAKLEAIILYFLSELYKDLGQELEQLNYARRASEVSLTLADDPYVLWPSISYGIYYLKYWGKKEMKSESASPTIPLLNTINIAIKILNENSNNRDKDYLISIASKLRQGYWALATYYANKGNVDNAYSYSSSGLSLIDKYEPDNLEARSHFLALQSISLTSNNRGVVNSKSAKAIYAIDLEVYKIRQNLYGEEDERTLSSLGLLSQGAKASGDWEKAIEYQSKHYGITTRVYGIYSLKSLDSLQNLATVYASKGQKGLADTTTLKYIDHIKIAHGPNSLEYTNVINEYSKRFKGAPGEYIAAEAIRLMRDKADTQDTSDSKIEINKSIASIKKLDAEEWSPDQYFLVYRYLLDFTPDLDSETALSLSYKFSKAAMNIWGKNSNEYLNSLVVSASCASLHDLDTSTLIYTEIEQLAKKIYPDNPGRLSEIFREIASHWLVLNDSKKSNFYLSKYVESRFKYYTDVLAYMSSEQRLNQMIEDDSDFNMIYSRPLLSQESLNIAIFAHLNRNGLLGQLEKNFNTLETKSKNSKRLLEKIQKLNLNLASLAASSVQYQRVLREKQKLEIEAGQEYGVEFNTISVSKIQANIPRSSTLVQFKLVPDKRFSTKFKYIAFLTPPSGISSVVNLGKASTINGLIATLLKYIHEQSPKYEEAAIKLRNILISPLEKQANGQNFIFVLDGQLHLLPLGLKEFQLSKNNQIAVLSSARDLLSKNPVNDYYEPALIVSNPDFGFSASRLESSPQAISGSISRSNITKSRSLSNIFWEKLPATRKEGDVIHSLLRGSHIYGENASKIVLKKSTNSPLILHIATHAYYASEVDNKDPQGIRQVATDALLRSGIVLAGANTKNNRLDGYLTALEISQLDLQGTQLVTLSACETALGSSLGSEGLFGLQRALSIAGVRSTLLSLWKVDDKSTSSFMQSYYSKLVDGKGRLEALDEVRREFQDHPIPAWRHPYYWAAFRLSGDTGPIQFE